MTRKSKRASKLDKSFMVAPSKTIIIQNEAHALMHQECLKVYFEHWRNFNHLTYRSKGLDGKSGQVERYIYSERDISDVFRENIIPDAKRRTVKGNYTIGFKKKQITPQ